jgi:hypothetical protein
VLTQEFIRLLGRVQPDNSLSDRWLALLSAEPDAAEKSDPTMPASLLEAWRGICLLPEAVTFGFVEDAAGRLCRAVEKRYSSDRFRRSVVEKYAAVPCVRTETGVFRKSALAGLWRQHQWLPLPHPLPYLLCKISDLGFLGQASLWLQNTGSPYCDLAELMYRARWQKTFPTRSRDLTRHPASKSDATTSMANAEHLFVLASQQNPEIQSDIELLAKQRHLASVSGENQE